MNCRSRSPIFTERLGEVVLRKPTQCDTCIRTEDECCDKKYGNPYFDGKRNSCARHKTEPDPEADSDELADVSTLVDDIKEGLKDLDLFGIF